MFLLNEQVMLKLNEAFQTGNGIPLRGGWRPKGIFPHKKETNRERQREREKIQKILVFN